MELVSKPFDMPRFSIITVCYNALTVLPDTLASLKGQSFDDYEWIVVDGASNDGTLDWLTIQSPDIFVSEPDKGIYDAMNKGIAMATGDWLFFLNAGDRFADSGVLHDIAAAIDAANVLATPPELVYGDVIYFGMQGQRRKRFNWLTRHRLIFGDLCHQAAFAARPLFANLGNFDISLRYNADFDWFVRVFKAQKPLLYVPRDIALFHDAGTHVTNHVSCESERDGVRARYCPRPKWVLGHLLLRVELKLRRMFGQTT
ncbi:glycosyltransferase family 2 protein [Glaciimonas immobilis]|uniref:Glycosyltransferase involved in cell wall biosynthesis n=1 Tax=Glaciimonas immobilis TaxID=728004 RepID=A0A840RRA8_9BURK|nr:glycosyltransferase family 2 protein [Glaciimonas immobilis]KAF3998161.1 glycosyltransferase [Glaciimonas immobilis]MBB5199131.1 glycosyltransferase involved in cell wall biosynthesis [Glaciimonas immobilis]